MIIWLLGSVGLTGILAIGGFILHTASEDFWGYQLGRDSSAEDYIVLFGELVNAGFNGVLQWMGESWRHPLAFLATVGGAVALVVRTPDRLHRPRVLFAALGLVAVVNFSWTDVPSFFLRDMLLDVGASSVQSGDGVVRSRAEALRERHICSRLTQDEIDRDQDAVLEVECTANPARYARALRNGFVLNLMLGLVNVFVLAAGAMWLLAGGAHELARTRTGRTWRLGLLAASAVMLLDVANVPYHYAKTARPTRVHRVRATVASQPPDRPLRGFLLSDGQTRLVLYNEDSGEVWTLPQGGVLNIILDDPEDVLSVHMRWRSR